MAEIRNQKASKEQKPKSNFFKPISVNQKLIPAIPIMPSRLLKKVIILLPRFLTRPQPTSSIMVKYSLNSFRVATSL